MPTPYIADTSLEMYRRNYLYENGFLTGLFMMLLDNLKKKKSSTKASDRTGRNTPTEYAD